MGIEPPRKRVPKGTESDVSEGPGLLGTDVHDLSGLFRSAPEVPALKQADLEEADSDVDEPMASGVLDMRALADAYASELGQRQEPAEAEEASPSMVNDEASLGLLIAAAEPEPATQHINYIVLAVAAVFLVAGTAAVTAFAVNRMAKPVVAAAPTPEQCAQLAAAPAATQPVAPVLAATAPAAVAPAAAQPAATPAVLPAVAPEDRTEGVEETDEEREARHERRRLRRERREAEAAAAGVATEAEEPPTPVVAETAVVDPPEPAPAIEPEPEAKPAASAAKCDEVACLVNPGRACCAKRAPVAKKEEPKQDLPERLSASDVNTGLRKVRGRISSCGDRHGFKGTATIKLTITPAGKVGSASVAKGNAAFKSCVTGHVKKASFKQTRKGMTLDYPLVFR